MLLQDSTIRDSMRANGYKNLKQIVQDRFGGQVPDEPEGGDLDPDKFNDEPQDAPKDKKDGKVKQVFDKLLNREKDKDKKGGGGGEE
jgi:hypothetical protein